MTETNAAVIGKRHIRQNQRGWRNTFFSSVAVLIVSVNCPSFAAAGFAVAQPLIPAVRPAEEISSSEIKSLILLAKTDTSEKPLSRKKKANKSEDQIGVEKKDPVSQTKPYTEEAIKHYNHGVELHQAGFLNQAIGEYKAAIAADDRVEEAYSNLGVIYAAQHNYPRAKEAFVQALKLKPNRPTTLNGLGTVLYAQGQITQATEKWKEALAADPKFASAYYNMGNAYEGEKNLAEAKTCYMKAITVMPNMADAYYRLGNILSKEHHYAQAEVLLKKAIELAPDGEFVRDARRSLVIIEGRFEKVRFKNQIQRKSKNSERTEKTG